MATRPKLLLIDAFAVIHRAYHAIPPFTTKNGDQVNAVYGFLSIFLKAVREIEPTHMAVAFDTDQPTKRHEVFKEYKAQRPKMPDTLAIQLPYIVEALKILKVPMLALPGYEAEDLIGTVIKKVGKSVDVVILTGDLDLLQLIDGNVTVFAMRRGLSDVKIYNRAKMKEDWGIDPEQWADMKAFKGDASDNIPGVPGIGEKTAVDLVKQFRSVEGVIEAMDKIPDKIRTKIEPYSGELLATKSLVTIDSTAEFPFELKLSEWNPWRLKDLLPFVDRLEFQSLRKRIEAKNIQQGQLL
jgi:DNA polymerase-1